MTNRQFTLSPYARWQASTGTILDARLSLSDESWKYSRTAGAGTANADIDGSSVGARLGIAQPFEMPVATITPFANVSYLHTSVEGYTEMGAGSANLDVPSYSVDQLEAFAGVSASREWMLANGTKLRGFGSVGIGNNFLGDMSLTTTYTSSPTPFISQIETESGVFGRIEAGLSANITPDFSITSTYGGAFGKDRNQHTVNLGLSLRL